MTDHAKKVREARQVLIDEGDTPWIEESIAAFESAIRAQERAEAHAAGCVCSSDDPFLTRVDSRCRARRDGQ